MSNIEKYSEKVFEDIKNINEYGNEYWYGRDLQKILEYTQWRNFKLVIEKAKIACKSSHNEILDHFADVSKTIEMPKNATKDIEMKTRITSAGVWVSKKRLLLATEAF